MRQTLTGIYWTCKQRNFVLFVIFVVCDDFKVDQSMEFENSVWNVCVEIKDLKIRKKYMS
jgi:hypothetical protein